MQQNGLIETPIITVAKNSAEIENTKPALHTYSTSAIDREAIRRCCINGEQLMQLSTETPSYLVDGILLSEGTSCLTAQPDSLKSMLARQLCIGIGAGQPEFIKFKLNALNRRALFITTEDSRQNSSFLFKTQVEAIDKAAASNVDFLTVEDSLSVDEILYGTNDFLSKHKYDLVVVDCYGDVFAGPDGNSNVANRNTVKIFNRLALEYHTHFLLIHHISKAGYQSAPNQRYIMGAASLVQKVRTAIQIKPVGNIHWLTVVKGNATPSHLKQVSFALTFDPKTFLLTNTGETCALEELEQNKFQKKKERGDLKEKVIKLKSEDLSVREIAERMNESGIKISKSTVANLIGDGNPEI